MKIINVTNATFELAELAWNDQGLEMV